MLWTSPSGVNDQLLGGTPVPLTACNTQLGNYMSATSVQVLPGLWMASWTKAGPGIPGQRGQGNRLLRSHLRQRPRVAAPNRRRPVCETRRCDGRAPRRPPGTVFLASATPILGPSPDAGSVTSAILLNVSRMVFTGSSLEATTEVIGTVELSRMAPVGTEYEGPDWPAVSILPPNKVSVAWLEPVPPAATSCASSAIGSARLSAASSARAANYPFAEPSVFFGEPEARAQDAGPASELRARDFFFDASHVAIGNVQKQERDGTESRLRGHPARYLAPMRRLMASVDHNQRRQRIIESALTLGPARFDHRDHVARAAQRIDFP